MRDSESDETVKSHIGLLYNVLEELQDVISRKNDLLRNGVITSDLLWTVFEPNRVIFSIENGRKRAFRLDAGEFDPFTRSYQISASCIDFDGTKFWQMPCGFPIPPYEGTKPIMSFSVFLLIYHANQALTRKDLIYRGKLWSEHKGHHYKQYEGLALIDFMNREVKYNVNSRIIIDAEAYNAFKPDDSSTFPISISSDLTDNHLLVTTPVLQEYSLKDKKRPEFFIDGVSDIVWNARAFDSLVLPMATTILRN